MYKRVGNYWSKIPGGAVRISVDDEGNPWCVNDASFIFKWTKNKWKQMPGSANDIGCGGGQVWVIGTN